MPNPSIPPVSSSLLWFGLAGLALVFGYKIIRNDSVPPNRPLTTVADNQPNRSSDLKEQSVLSTAQLPSKPTVADVPSGLEPGGTPKIKRLRLDFKFRCGIPMDDFFCKGFDVGFGEENAHQHYFEKEEGSDQGAEQLKKDPWYSKKISNYGKVPGDGNCFFTACVLSACFQKSYTYQKLLPAFQEVDKKKFECTYDPLQLQELSQVFEEAAIESWKSENIEAIRQAAKGIVLRGYIAGCISHYNPQKLWTQQERICKMVFVGYDDIRCWGKYIGCPIVILQYEEKNPKGNWTHTQTQFIEEDRSGLLSKFYAEGISSVKEITFKANDELCEENCAASARTVKLQPHQCPASFRDRDVILLLFINQHFSLLRDAKCQGKEEENFAIESTDC